MSVVIFRHGARFHQGFRPYQWARENKRIVRMSQPTAMEWWIVNRMPVIQYSHFLFWRSPLQINYSLVGPGVLRQHRGFSVFFPSICHLLHLNRSIRAATSQILITSAINGAMLKAGTQISAPVQYWLIHNMWVNANCDYSQIRARLPLMFDYNRKITVVLNNVYLADLPLLFHVFKSLLCLILTFGFLCIRCKSAIAIEVLEFKLKERDYVSSNPSLFEWVVYINLFIIWFLFIPRRIQY